MPLLLSILLLFLLFGLLAFRHGDRAGVFISLGGILLGAGLIVRDGHWDAALPPGVRDILTHGLMVIGCCAVIYAAFLRIARSSRP
jgi:hypothetical protein